MVKKTQSPLQKRLTQKFSTGNLLDELVRAHVMIIVLAVSLGATFFLLGGLELGLSTLLVWTILVLLALVVIASSSIVGAALGVKDTKPKKK